MNLLISTESKLSLMEGKKWSRKFKVVDNSRIIYEYD